MKLGKLFLCLLYSIYLTGCASVVFENNSKKVQSEVVYSSWHHNLFWGGVYEVSGPKAVEEYCKDGAWSEITTSFSAGNFISTSGASTAVGLSALFYHPLIGFMFNPWVPLSVEIECELST